MNLRGLCASRGTPPTVFGGLHLTGRLRRGQIADADAGSSRLGALVVRRRNTGGGGGAGGINGWCPPRFGVGTKRCVRRCPTLPHDPSCSTIGAERLSFRVRNGTGRFPFAMTAVTPSGPTEHQHPRAGLFPGPTLTTGGSCFQVDVLGVTQWTRTPHTQAWVVKLSAY